MNTDSKSDDGQMTAIAQVLSAYATSPNFDPSKISEVANAVRSALSETTISAPAPEAAKPTPAVPVKKSVTPDYIVCLEDGKKLKMLKRHLRTTYSMTPEEYRAKWGLTPDYPMVAPNYATARSEMAKKIGLGRKPAAIESAEPRRRGPGRKQAAASAAA